MLQVLLNFTLAAAILGATLLVGCGSASSSGRKQVLIAPREALVAIPPGQELFPGFMPTVQPKTMVRWQNDDTLSYTSTTTWDQIHFLHPQAFSITAADQNVSFTFTEPGIFASFDKAETRRVETDQRVKALTNLPLFLLAPEEIIWVPGPLPGLPFAATNLIANRNEVCDIHEEHVFSPHASERRTG